MERTEEEAEVHARDLQMWDHEPLTDVHPPGLSTGWHEDGQGKEKPD